jgi:hypothetical protein
MPPVDGAYFLIPSGYTLDGQTIHGHFFFGSNQAGLLRSQSHAPYGADNKVCYFAVARDVEFRETNLGFRLSRLMRLGPLLCPACFCLARFSLSNKDP